ncbi:DoxX family protein [Aeromonas enteropelogenes]|uniref:DoxX family protein n=1 Tax=Aeromonas enteropelogenes TaxID=29489 RepID=UPI003BA3B6B5
MMANKWMPIALGDRELPGWLTGVVLLLARCWVALVFCNAGWLKLTSWDSTLYLFEFEYQVPLLPWLWAAWLGTAAELVLPLFLLAGLLTRPVALLLSGFNVVAVISYPALWAGGFHDHQLWGWMLLTLVIWGGGSLSLDSWLSRRRG